MRIASAKLMTLRCDCGAAGERERRVQIDVQDYRWFIRRVTAGRSQSTAASRELRRPGTQLESIAGVSIETASVAAIDMRAIIQLAENDELGDQFVTEIIDVFLGDLSKRVDAIGLLMSQGDGAAIAGSAHAIKGSCGHFGAARLMELSREVENLGRRGQTDGLQDAIDAMVAETQRVRAALEAYRSSHAPQ